MQASASLLLHNAPTPFSRSSDLKTRALGLMGPESNRRSSYSTCRASSQDAAAAAATEFNLYELLGVEASSDGKQIKEAYRALQKRCHPDIAGPPGHDMAIVLNEAYALLSDPNSRMAYDRELAKVADLQGYTGRPIYSAWCGPESEQRAVFVDEVKCVGCLKCALFAQKTFAVESVYGRARVVAQWADPEHKIHDAIASCPVDCISMVERADLPALEFVMSKQPRGRVRIGAANTTGVRTADIFDEVAKFQLRYAQNQASKSQSKDSELQRASRLSAVQAIHMISNWLYWQYPTTDAYAPLTTYNSTTKQAPPSVKKLKAAAAARKQAKTTAPRAQQPGNSADYWVPSGLALPQTTAPSSVSEPRADGRETSPPSDARGPERMGRRTSPPSDARLSSMIGTGAALVAAVVVHLQIGGEAANGLKEHVGGSVALAIINSSWMQVGLAGVTWYLIGMYMVEIVEALRRK